jgi:Tol biopolymer transport system component
MLWLFDLKQKTEVQLVPDFETAGVGGVDWSRDGYIYFSGKTRGGNQDIYKILPDGTGLTNLTETPEDEFDVSVSDDGTLVAYNHLKSRWLKRKPEIWIMRSDGSQKRMIYDGGPEWGTFGGFPIGSFDPEISPDNKRIVFSTTHTRHNNFGGAGGQEICMMNLDGSGFVRFPCPQDGICMIPDWKDDLLLFTKYGEKEGYVGLATMSPDGKNERKLEKNLKQLWDGGRHGKWIAPLDASWPYTK